MVKPDSTRSSSAFQTRMSGPEWIEADVAEALSESHLGRPFNRPEELPADAVLDVRLHEILQQARLTTAANGAVIALASGDRMVCRATLGDRAPRVGVSMNTRSGLSGACVQSREMQLCDDSLADPRVNATACRDLGMRSIVVVPVLSGGELWGMLEVFASVPHAFNESDLQSLQSLSRKISRTVQEAIETGSRAVAAGAFTQLDLEPALAQSPPAPNPAERYSQAAVPRDYRTGVLTVGVLALAVFLGWMVGRVGWSMAVNRAPIQIPLASEESPVVARVKPEGPRVPPRQASQAEAQPTPAPVVSSPDPSVSNRPVTRAKSEPAQPAEPRGGLVVYEHGKVVFRMPPDEDESLTRGKAVAGVDKPGVGEPGAVEPGVVEPGAIQKAVTREDDEPVSPAPAASPLANGYLLERVEPQYPEAAKQQRIQGPVMLHALVGADGSVKELSVISGNPQLVKAATDAVRQWRFKPHQLRGKAVEFETRITVNFALPE